MQSKLARIEAEGARSLPSVGADGMRRSLSDSFREFVRPLLERLPERSRLPELRDPLLVAAAVWNEVIARSGDPDGAVANVAEMIEEFQDEPISPALHAILEALAARKSSLFRDDRRLVVELEAHRQGADVRVVARTMAMPGMNAVLVPTYLARNGFRDLVRDTASASPFGGLEAMMGTEEPRLTSRGGLARPRS